MPDAITLTEWARRRLHRSSEVAPYDGGLILAPVPLVVRLWRALTRSRRWNRRGATDEVDVWPLGRVVGVQALRRRSPMANGSPEQARLACQRLNGPRLRRQAVDGPQRGRDSRVGDKSVTEECPGMAYARVSRRGIARFTGRGVIDLCFADKGL
jgi:hypothetical protein